MNSSFQTCRATAPLLQKSAPAACNNTVSLRVGSLNPPCWRKKNHLTAATLPCKYLQLGARIFKEIQNKLVLNKLVLSCWVYLWKATKIRWAGQSSPRDPRFCVTVKVKRRAWLELQKRDSRIRFCATHMPRLDWHILQSNQSADSWDWFPTTVVV